VKRNSSSIQITSSLSRDVITDQQNTFELVVCNDGVLESGFIQIQIPDVEWVKLASPNPIPSLQPDECTTVSILITIASTNKRSAEVQVLLSLFLHTYSDTRALIHCKFHFIQPPPQFNQQYKSHLLLLLHQLFQSQLWMNLKQLN
jgi:hypothetical protein